MDNSVSDSDISLSPSQILERLQLLRELQLRQRGKLEKQQLQYEDSPTTSGSITEIISRFTNSTSYNTFRSLLQGSYDDTNASPQLRAPNSEVSPKITNEDLIEGVSVLHVSQESEFVITSPISSKRKSPLKSTATVTPPRVKNAAARDSNVKKQIELDEMPILSPKTDFMTLVEEKMQKEGKKPVKKVSPKDKMLLQREKKPFLKRGQGMSRFGIDKKDLVIQNTQSLPWKRQGVKNNKKQINPKPNNQQKANKNIAVEIIAPDVRLTKNHNENKMKANDMVREQNKDDIEHVFVKPQSKVAPQSLQQSIPPPTITITKPNSTKSKHPLSVNRKSTWASILTKEQNDFLTQLKQSDYYKNFVSPTKSVASDISCDGDMYKVRQEKEKAEQNMFELLENKTSNESFNLENSFFHRFLRNNQMEYSGDSTPLIMQRCLAENPKLLRIPTGTTQQEITCDTSHCESCDCCTDCDHETCSSISTCSCKTVENTPQSNHQKNTSHKQKETKKATKEVKQKPDKNNDRTENDNMKENMADMNAKLIATSELLKERLRELEDEIETFRKENTILTKSREELDNERQRFYEEKSTFEQKCHEDKILSEYYLAEEKDKLSKQKLMYERYVREIRGRLNKKEKDEVTNLKKEIEDLKEDIRIKDIKSTSTIARLRNQIKVLEKDKKDLNDEVEKLKKENRRLSHSNDITRRMTNIKYLEQINKKLRNINTKDTQSEVQVDKDAKYKSFEIERQSRNRQRVATTQTTIRPRAKSVPNLNVTSRYAKYFSQKDSFSQMDRNHLDDDDSSVDGQLNYNDDDLDHGDVKSLHDNQENYDYDHEDNNLEKLYLSRFKNDSPEQKSDIYKSSRLSEFGDQVNESGDFFLQKNSTMKRSVSPPYRNKSPNFTSSSRTRSPISVISQHMYKEAKAVEKINENLSKSPVSILSNRNSYPDKISSNLNGNENSQSSDFNKTNISRTSLNPREIIKADGSKEYIFPNGNVKYISADSKYSKFLYYNGDVKENFFDEGRVKYYYAETKTYHTTHSDGHEVIEFADGQIEKRYKDGSSEIRLPNGSVRYHDPKNVHVREEWRFPDGTTLTVSAAGEQRVVFSNGQVEVHAKDHKRREFPDGTVKLIYNDGTSETRYSSGRVRIKDKHGNLIMDSAPG